MFMYSYCYECFLLFCAPSKNSLMNLCIKIKDNKNIIGLFRVGTIGLQLSQYVILL
jgi:hypothetical protein